MGCPKVVNTANRKRCGNEYCENVWIICSGSSELEFTGTPDEWRLVAQSETDLWDCDVASWFYQNFSCILMLRISCTLSHYCLWVDFCCSCHIYYRVLRIPVRCLLVNNMFHCDKYKTYLDGTTWQLSEFIRGRVLHRQRSVTDNVTVQLCNCQLLRSLQQLTANWHLREAVVVFP
jgi:hypothetical protein